MVKLYTSLLAVTLATGSALASSESNDYERRSELDGNNQVPVHHFRYGLACVGRCNVHPREFVDEEDLFVREDAFDDLEAREPGKALGSAFKVATKVAQHKNTKNTLKAIDYGTQAYGLYSSMKQSRGFEDDEDVFVRDLDASDDLEAREPINFKAFKSGFKAAEKIAKHKHTKNAFKAVDYGSQIYGNLQQSRGFEDDEDIFVRDLDASDDLEAREPFGFNGKALGSAFKAAEKIAEHKHTKNAFKAVDYGSQIYGNLHQSRGFEDDEDIFVRDLDASDDLEAREPIRFNFKEIGEAFKAGKRIAEHKHTKHAFKAVNYGSQIYGNLQQRRGFEDDEEIFGRDLDAEEFFERDFDLLD